MAQSFDPDHASFQDTAREILRARDAYMVQSMDAKAAFAQAARARALLAGRDHAVPDDVQALAHRVLRHRIILGFEAVADDVPVERVIDAIITAVRTP